VLCGFPNAFHGRMVLQLQEARFSLSMSLNSHGEAPLPKLGRAVHKSKQS